MYSSANIPEAHVYCILLYCKEFVYRWVYNTQKCLPIMPSPPLNNTLFTVIIIIITIRCWGFQNTTTFSKWLYNIFKYLDFFYAILKRRWLTDNSFFPNDNHYFFASNHHEDDFYFFQCNIWHQNSNNTA